MLKQGSAADIVKGVMVGLQQQLQAVGLAGHCTMLLQVRVVLCGPDQACS
jgi:DNA polymerase I-like protein with 3'-5' exonuclease and polymerase domains